MEKIINVKITGSEIEQSSTVGGIQGEANARILKITFDDEWKAYSISVKFLDANMENPVKVLLTTANQNEDGSYNVPIPKEALATGEKFTYIIDGSSEDVIQRSVSKELKVRYAPVVNDASLPSAVTPSEADQLNLSIQKESARIDVLNDKMSETEEDISAFKVSIENEIAEVEAIAKGRATGYVFDTEADMNAWLENADNVSKLVVGDNLYIRNTDVPDRWWDGTTAQKLETQKVDLSEYAKKKEVEELEPLIVNLHMGVSEIYSADKNIDDIVEAYKKDKQILVKNQGGIYFTPFVISESAKSATFYHVRGKWVERVTCDENGWTYDKTILAIQEDTDKINSFIKNEFKSLMYYGNANIKPSDVNLFGFTVDDETMTANVGAAYLSGTVAIPYEYEKNGKLYTVTSISYGGIVATDIEKVILPSTITTIMGYGFYGNEKLVSITIPSSVTEIGAEAFNENTNLANVYYTGTKEQWDNIEIGNLNKPLLNAKIHYNYVSLDDKADKPFIVNVTVDENMNITSDKNFDDIAEAFKSGRQIMLKEFDGVVNMYYYMTDHQYNENGNFGSFSFKRTSGVYQHYIGITEMGWEDKSRTIVLAQKSDLDKVKIDLENKADKTSLVIVNESTYNFEFADLYNKIVRAKTMESISFNVEASEYSNLYEAELCFDSGETPTRIDYTVPENSEQIQIINWVGVDCANTSYVNSEGETVPISVFSPVANKHYEIVFQYNGTQLIAWVGGFTPASGNVVSA